MYSFVIEISKLRIYINFFSCRLTSKNVPLLLHRFFRELPSSPRVNGMEKRNVRKNTCLPYLTSFLAFTSLGVILIALMTNEWLYTVERIPPSNVNKTSFNTSSELKKISVSGLWINYISDEETGENERHDIFEFFQKIDESHISYPGDSAWAVPYAVTRSIGFFVLSATLLCFAEICYVMSMIRKNDLLIFTSGVVFIITGLVMLASIITLISVFRAEVGYKLKPPINGSPLLNADYGYSFLLYLSGLALVEATGTCVIFVYLMDISESSPYTLK